MLILTRRIGENIIIGDDVIISMLDLKQKISQLLN